MRRGPLLAALGALAAAALAIAVGPAWVRADDPARGPAPPPAAALVLDAEERALLDEVDRGKLIAARERAQRRLDRDPRSFAAAWALAQAHALEEGNFARALYYVRRAERLLHERGLDPAWHRRVILAEANILGEMDRTDDQLAVFDRIAALYPPGADALKLWPLLKQRRYDEARALAEELLLRSDDDDDRQRAHNALGSIAEELRQRDEAYQRMMTAIQEFPDACTLLRNAGVLAWERFRPQRAEELLLRAAVASDNDCRGTPYTDVAWHHLLAGEINQAVAALKKAQAEPTVRYLRAHAAHTHRAMLADLLHVVGKPAEAARYATEVYEQPERSGGTSNSAAFARLTRTLRYWLALDNLAHFEAERASYRGLGAGLGRRARIALARWEARRALFQLAADAEALVTITRPNLADVHVARWSVGGLAEALGPGVMATAVADARALDAAYPEAAPYLDALAGEIAYRRGELAGARALAARALEGIPREDNLIRWYVMAWQADAAERTGDRDAALAGYHEVLQKLPSTLRILDLALPAAIRHDGDARARDVAGALAKSPRFTHDAGGLVVEVTARDREVTVCLTDRHGLQYACAGGAGDVADVLDAFHAAAFSPKVAMTQADLNSLDGNTGSRTADQVLEGLLGK